MALYGGGGSVVTMPSTPWPSAVEMALNHLAAANTNPFTGQQQTQDWQVSFQEASISLPPMKQSVALPWITFLNACNGTVNVFQFPVAFADQFGDSFYSDMTSIYWRMKSGQVKWSIKPGSIYSLIFEIRQAI